MNYTAIYERLIYRGKNSNRKRFKKSNPKYVYYERHHIIPKCMNGSDDPENLVLLTPEEHWVAHLLLVKIHPEVSSLVFACQAMLMNGPRNNRSKNKLFGTLRKKVGELTTERQKGVPCPEQKKSKISATLKGREAPHQKGDNNVSKRPEVAKKISDAKKGKKTGPRPEEVKRKISNTKKGRKHLSGEDNPSFKGWSVATSVQTGAEIWMSTKEEMVLNGFYPSCVYACIRGTHSKKNIYKGHKFRREHIPKNR
jgi:hypothetical protein